MRKLVSSKAVCETCKAKQHDERVHLGWLLTRGVGELGLNPYLCAKPQADHNSRQLFKLYPKKLYDNGWRS